MSENRYGLINPIALDASSQETSLSIGVLPQQAVRGVRAPGTVDAYTKMPATYDWRARPRSAANTARVTAQGYVIEMLHALVRPYRTDAHFVAYVLVAPEGRVVTPMPRLNKSSLPWLYGLGYRVYAVGTLLDIDLPRGPRDPVTLKPTKRTWTPALRAEHDALWRNATSLAHAARYFTRGGWRAVTAFARWVPIEIVPAGALTLFEKMIALAIVAAHDDGITPDEACSDWTRLYRAPCVMRGEFPNAERTPLDLDVARFAPVDPEPLLDAATRAASTRRAIYAGVTAEQEQRAKTKTARAAAPPPTPEAQEKTRARVDGKNRVERARQQRAAAGHAEQFDRTVDPQWAWLVECVGAVARAHPPPAWHAFSMALAGALVWHWWRTDQPPAQQIPAIVAGVCARGGDAWTTSHYFINGVDTVVAAVRGGPVTGMPTLAASYPEVAASLSACFARGSAPVDQSGLPSADEASAQLETLFDVGLPPGVTLVGVTCGAGKSEAWLRVSIAKARTAMALRRLAETPDADGATRRANVGPYMTAIATNSNRLAIQHYERLRAEGIPVARVFSPVSVKRPDGTLECRYPVLAVALAGAGQSVPYELCTKRGTGRCDHWNACAARGGSEGDARPVVLVGNQWMLSELAAHAGDKGALAIDEMRSMVETHDVTEGDIRVALAQTAKLTARYGAAMRPLLRAVADALSDDGFVLPEGGTVYDLIKAGSNYAHLGELEEAVAAAGVDPAPLDRGDGLQAARAIVACARRAFDADVTNDRCPVRRMHVEQAKHSAALAAEIATLCRVHNALYDAVADAASGEPAGAWVARAPHAALHLVHVYRPLHRLIAQPPALRIAVLDASMDPHVAVVKNVLGARYDDKQLVKIDVRDAGEVRRVMVQCNASRRRLKRRDGGWNWDAVALLLGYATRQLDASPWVHRVGVATYKGLDEVINDLVGEAPADAQTRARLYRDDADAAAAAAALLPVLRAHGRAWRAGHYGALRGLNHWMDLHAIVTLGDERPNLDACHREAKYLGASAEAWSAMRARAESEQAHGRGRTPRATGRFVQVHVGDVLPGGAGWLGPSVAFVGGDAPDEAGGAESPDVATVRRAVALAGSRERLASDMGVGRTTVLWWMRGQRLSVDVIERLKLYICSKTGR